MTIHEAIDTLDTRRQNTFTRREKLAWLSRLDGKIREEILSGYCHEAPVFSGYTDDTDPDTALLVPAPWDEIYLWYMEAQIDCANGEMTRYENSAALFNTCFTDYKNHYHRTHTPKGANWRYF